MKFAVFASLFSLSNCIVSDAQYLYNKTRPLLIGHRGTPGLFPEHTHASYSNAYVENADFVELDL
jgi:glycerophosphoryl diester phosphodiesterase